MSSLMCSIPPLSGVVKDRTDFVRVSLKHQRYRFKLPLQPVTRTTTTLRGPQHNPDIAPTQPQNNPNQFPALCPVAGLSRLSTITMPQDSHLPHNVRAPKNITSLCQHGAPGRVHEPSARKQFFAVILRWEHRSNNGPIKPQTNPNKTPIHMFICATTPYPTIHVDCIIRHRAG